MPGPHAGAGDFTPSILVFSTNNISDPGIDLAGSAHMHYSPGVVTISMPCSSGVKPSWILHAARRGFDGVFIAADGEECAYLPDCAERVARNAGTAQALLREHGYDPRRLKMAAICSVCADPFTGHMREFGALLAGLGPVAAERVRDDKAQPTAAGRAGEDGAQVTAAGRAEGGAA